MRYQHGPVGGVGVDGVLSQRALLLSVPPARGNPSRPNPLMHRVDLASKRGGPIASAADTGRGVAEWSPFRICREISPAQSPLFLFLELCLMDRVSFGEAGSGLNPLFPQPVSGVGASHLSGAQKRQRRGKELAIQAFPEVGFLRGQRDGLSLSLSPFPHPYIALSLPLLSIPPPSAWQHPHKPPSPRQAGLPACRPRCAKRGSGKERKAASEGDGASAEKGAFPLCHSSAGPARKRLPLSACGCYPLFTGTGALAVLWTFYLTLSVSTEKDCKKGKAKQIKPEARRQH